MPKETSNIIDHPAYKNALPLSAEQMSDLMDSQNDEHTLEQLLASNENQSKTWYRYNLVSSVLNKQHSVHSSFEFNQMISDQIAREPAFSNQQSAQVISFWKKATGGLAIAASVAFAMVFSVQMMNNAPQPSTHNTHSMALESNVLPSQINSTNSAISIAEQQQLDDIQRILDNLNQGQFKMNEQLVGGEIMVQSFVVKPNQQATQFEEKIRSMKKPSESNKGY